MAGIKQATAMLCLDNDAMVSELLYDSYPLVDMQFFPDNVIRTNPIEGKTFTIESPPMSKLLYYEANFIYATI